ncbi:MAG: CinA family protein [Acidovorax sp.]|nr:CinA family protein [Acidovorax sp.]
MTTVSLSKKELLALDHQALEANLIQISLELLRHKHRLVTAESCTGGMVAAACTDLAGASDWFDRGFVTYSDVAKTDMLSVPAALIAQHGAVSEAVARAMADGALNHSAAHVSLAVTGVAGPGGGSDAKPVGTVWFAWCVAGETHSEMQHFAGDRTAIRASAVRYALQRLLGFLVG